MGCLDSKTHAELHLLLSTQQSNLTAVSTGGTRSDELLDSPTCPPGASHTLASADSLDQTTWVTQAGILHAP
jgi:hypothetical protein